MDCKSVELSHIISLGGVTTILPMIEDGTDSSLAIRAIETVAALEEIVSRPFSSEAPWTPIWAL
jgi:hypothetical protein